MRYKEWKLLTESVMPSMNLGLSQNPTVGGLVGSQFQEVGFGKDIEDEDLEDEDEELEDDLEDEDELEGDLLGADDEEGIMGSEEGPEKSFPPDDAEEMEPEMGDEMDGVLGDIDPDLAGLGGDMEGDMEMEPEMGGDMEMEPEMGPEMGDELGAEMGDMGGDMGDMEMGDMEMGDELGDMEMGGDMEGDDIAADFADVGDDMEMGDELGDMEGEDEMGLSDEMGDMELEDDMEDDIEAEIEDEDEAEEAELMRMMKHYAAKYMDKDCDDKDHDHKHHMKKENTLQVESVDLNENPLAAVGGIARAAMANPAVRQAGAQALGAGAQALGQKAGEMAGNVMDRMVDPKQDYMDKEGGLPDWLYKARGEAMRRDMGRKHMSSCGGKKFMDKDGHEDHKKHMSSCGGKKYMDADDVKPRDIDNNGKIDGWEKGKAAGLKKALSDKKHMKCCESNDDFFTSLSNNAKGEVRQKFSSGLTEDALFQPVDVDSLQQTLRDEPEAGEAGFAPQGRIGAIGGGYTADDIADIPTLGESRKYMTLEEFIAKKNSN